MTNEVTHAYIDHLKGRFGERVYKKKPIEVQAYQIENDFHVKTMEGVMRGKAGDYVIVGVENEIYPCDKDIFIKTYDYVGISEEEQEG